VSACKWTNGQAHFALQAVSTYLGPLTSLRLVEVGRWIMYRGARKLNPTS